MANLTTKELDALSDQLNYEKLMACKYTPPRRAAPTRALQPPSTSMPSGTRTTTTTCSTSSSDQTKGDYS